MRYWRIANSDGKVWLMPRTNTAVALELYQPSGWKGKLIKMLLPTLAALPECLSPFPIQDWMIEDRILEVVRHLFPGKQLEWSIFEGTPCVHRKRTIQVYCGKEILAYCKVSSSPDIQELFTHEADLLSMMHGKGIGHIPQCLYLDSIGENNQQLMVLSTEKTVQSEVLHEWTDLHQAFIENLQSRTTQYVPFEECDLAQGINLLKERWNCLPSCMEKSVLESAINRTVSYNQGRMMECAVIHGDFTPWNMFVENGHLFVFDWEYAFGCCPKGLDRYHFFTQTAFFERHWSSDKIMAYAQTQDGSWIEKNEYIYYLILIVSRFVGREPKGKKIQDTKLFALWNYLLKLCMIEK